MSATPRLERLMATMITSNTIALFRPLLRGTAPNATPKDRHAEPERPYLTVRFPYAPAMHEFVQVMSGFERAEMAVRQSNRH